MEQLKEAKKLVVGNIYYDNMGRSKEPLKYVGKDGRRILFEAMSKHSAYFKDNDGLVPFHYNEKFYEQ